MNSEIDLTKHELIPEHRILSAEEKEKIKKRYRIKKDTQFPKIIKKDPVIKTIGAKPGDLLEITKKSSIIDKVTYYRIVVD